MGTSVCSAKALRQLLGVHKVKVESYILGILVDQLCGTDSLQLQKQE